MAGAGSARAGRRVAVGAAAGAAAGAVARAAAAAGGAVAAPSPSAPPGRPVPLPPPPGPAGARAASAAPPAPAATAAVGVAPPPPASVEEAYREGVRLFAAADVGGSARAFDAAWEVAPEEVRRRLWQRGISLYYAGRFAEGARQFREDATTNSSDSEEAIWCFLCEARSLGPAAARERFVPTGPDSRPLLRAALVAFREGAGAEAILAAAPPPGRLATVAPGGLKDLFYATLYAGLYCEAEGREAEARHYLTTAAEMKYANRSGDYMGAVARVHCRVRGWI